jgi:PAS domain S-box-containing protein
VTSEVDGACGRSLTAFDVRKTTRSLHSIRHFRQIADNLPVVLALANADLTRFLFVNSAYREIWGRTVESLYANSMSFLDGIHPDDRDCLKKALEGLVKGKPIKGLECRVIRPDSSTSWVLCQGYTVRNARGEIVRLVGSAEDITDRKVVEDALRKSEDRYRDLVEHSNDLICTHDLQGILLSVNEPPLRILGFTREELLNKPLRNFVTPETRPHCDIYLDQIKQDGFAKGILNVLTKNGQVRLWEFNNSLRRDGVNPPIVRGVAHDITEQKRAETALRKSEEKFSKAFRSSPVEMVITTLDEGRFLDVNESFERAVGLSRDSLIGRTSSKLGLWVDPAERASIVEEVKRDGRVVNREIHLRAKSGEVRIKLLSAEPILISGEACLLSVSIDITDRKKTEEELCKLSGQLLRSQDDERRKIARELHDTTGQSLVAAAILLRQIQLAAPSSIMKQVSECAELIEQCISEIRTLSYLLFPPMLESAGIESAIRHYLNGFVERTGLFVELEVSASIPRLASDVELALFRVVQESLINIHRHSGSKTAKISLYRERGQVLLEASDRGRGIPGSEENENKSDSPRLGVGIPSMMERIKQVGGGLEIESSDLGTTIRVKVHANDAKR